MTQTSAVIYQKSYKARCITPDQTADFDCLLDAVALRLSADDIVTGRLHLLDLFGEQANVTVFFFNNLIDSIFAGRVAGKVLQTAIEEDGFF